MRILHYYPGPKRQGGMNRYATDLALEQKKNGDEVFCLCPVGGLFNSAVRISRGHRWNGLTVFELHGGLPVALLEGIRDPQIILDSPHKLSAKAVQDFCDLLQIDLLHIHTWMGFPVELLDEVKRRKIKVVFTTHDYYGLCPKVNFVDTDGLLCTAPCNSRCSKCNAAAPSEFYLRLRNFPLLLQMKSILQPLMKLRARLKKSTSASLPETTVEKNYDALFAYYRKLFLSCDRIHFNSPVTQMVFQRFIPELEGDILSISHAGISDRRKKRQTGTGKIRLAVFGGEAPYKGLPMLLKSLTILQNEGISNWHLDIWGTAERKKTENISWNGRFRQKDEYNILNEIDLLIVPSLWYETFGFIVPEALSAGVPVLCSDTVGAQSLITPEMVFHGAEDLTDKLRCILKDSAILNEENSRICQSHSILTISGHVAEMKYFYNKESVNDL